MHPIDHLLSAWPGRRRAELLATIPSPTDVLHQDAQGAALTDHHSLMSVMPKPRNQRPEVLIVEFDGASEVQFSELRRSFSDTRAAANWISRMEVMLMRSAFIEIGDLATKPVMRTTVHDGSLSYWCAWVVNDVSVLTIAIWRVSGADFPATATLSISASPWRSDFGPVPQMASFPHSPDEWAGWESAGPTRSEISDPTMDEILSAIRTVIAQDAANTHITTKA